MGAIGFFSSTSKCCCVDKEVVKETEYVNINPVPTHFKVLQVSQIGRYVIAKIKYPECINYEGLKIIVFDNDSIKQIKKRKEIDPHFFKDSNIIARFKPDNIGWKNAILLTTELYKRDAGVYEL